MSQELGSSAQSDVDAELARFEKWFYRAPHRFKYGKSDPVYLAAMEAFDAGLAAREEWQPIETAPKGGGAEIVTDPLYVNPPLLLLLFGGGEQVVCHWDWYYAEKGNGYRHGVSAWVEPISGEQISFHLDEPTSWMPLLNPPKEKP